MTRARASRAKLELHESGTFNAKQVDADMPRFLPTINPTQFNYPIDIRGKCHGNRYRFVQRYRSGQPETLGEEFDAPFTRLDWMSRDASISNGIDTRELGYGHAMGGFGRLRGPHQLGFLADLE